jgi:hypothetical protein
MELVWDLPSVGSVVEACSCLPVMPHIVLLFQFISIGNGVASRGAGSVVIFSFRPLGKTGSAVAVGS